MRVSAFTSFIASCCLVWLSALPAVSHANPLIVERWQSRPLVVIVPRQDHPLIRSLNSQLRVPEIQQEFREREMTLYTVIAGDGRLGESSLSPHQTASLLDALGVSPEGPAQVILVGKDGGVKLQETGDSVSMQDIFKLIDGMPMRRNP